MCSLQEKELHMISYTVLVVTKKKKKKSSMCSDSRCDIAHSPPHTVLLHLPSCWKPGHLQNSPFRRLLQPSGVTLLATDQTFVREVRVDPDRQDKPHTGRRKAIWSGFAIWVGFPPFPHIPSRSWGVPASSQPENSHLSSPSSGLTQLLMSILI